MPEDEASRFDAVPVECIHLGDPADVAWWCNELAVDEQRLREVVSIVGPMGKAIRFWFASRPSGRVVTAQMRAKYELNKAARSRRRHPIERADARRPAIPSETEQP